MSPNDNWRRVVEQIPSRHMTGTRANFCFGFRETLAQQAAKFDQVRYLEIGVRRGHSLALAALSAGPRLERAVGVDMWIPEYGDEPQLGPDGVIDALEALDVDTRPIELITGDSHDVLPRIREAGYLFGVGRVAEKPTFNLILVDGDHTPGGAALDLSDCWKVLEPGGLLVFDDLVGELSEVWGSFVSRRVRRGEVASMSWWPSPGPPPWGWARKRP